MPANWLEDVSGEHRKGGVSVPAFVGGGLCCKKKNDVKAQRKQTLNSYQSVKGRKHPGKGYFTQMAAIP